MAGPPKPATIQPPLVQKALARLHAILKGNGINLQQVTVQKADVQDVSFSAGTFFELATTTAEKIVPGRHAIGQSISGSGDISRHISDVLDRARRNRGLEELLKNQLTQRKDKGFMLAGALLPVNGMDQEISWYEQCQTCQHSGHVRCDQCQGQKAARCQKCHGQTMMQCPLCLGAGHIQGQKGQQPCNKCNGMRRVPCTVCHRTGKIPCQKCRATGMMTCPACKGQIYSTRVVHIGLKATTQADYARAQVPEHMTFLIENDGPRLAAEGDIAVTAQQMNEEGKMGVHYEARFPFAEITFAIGKKPVKVDAYGDGKFVRLPNVLDSLLSDPLQSLMEAARGQGDVAALIKEAGRYRVIALALISTIRANAAQTTARLMDKYPQGLSPEMAGNIGKAADSAIALITRKPRYLGLFAGLLLVGILYAAYYIGPGRALVTPLIPDPRFNFILDLMIIVVGGAITTLSSQFAARGALHKALGPLIAPDKRKNLLPRTHGAGLWGYALGLILYVVMIEAARRIAPPAPEWYQALLSLIGLA